MAYLVLARKWRPRGFDAITGQEHVTRTLKNAILQDRVHHAFLFCGARGVGKTSAARVLARALNCERSQGPTTDPCGECPTCTEIAAGTSVDVYEIDGASNRGIGEIRELRDGIAYAPQRDRYKVYIIDEVHMLTTEAFNALLKTLEEPPAHVKFIFATTEPHKIPVTILSRCQRFDFKRIALPVMAGRLQEILVAEGVQMDPAGLRLVARESEGSMRDALSLLDRVISFAGMTASYEAVASVLGVADRAWLQKLVSAALDKDIPAALAVVAEAFDYGLDLKKFASDLVHHLRDAAILQVAGEGAPTELAKEERDSLVELGKRLAPEDMQRLVRLWTETAERLVQASFPRLEVEMAVIRMCRLRPLMPLDVLLTRLEAIERRLDSGAPLPPLVEEPRPKADAQAQRLGSVDPRPSEPVVLEKEPARGARASMEVDAGVGVARSTEVEAGVGVARSTEVDAGVAVARSTEVEAGVAVARSTEVDAGVAVARSTEVDAGVGVARSTEVEAGVGVARSTEVEAGVGVARSTEPVVSGARASVGADTPVGEAAPVPSPPEPVSGAHGLLDTVQPAQASHDVSPLEVAHVPARLEPVGSEAVSQRDSDEASSEASVQVAHEVPRAESTHTHTDLSESAEVTAAREPEEAAPTALPPAPTPEPAPAAEKPKKGRSRAKPREPQPVSAATMAGDLDSDLWELIVDHIRPGDAVLAGMLDHARVAGLVDGVLTLEVSGDITERRLLTRLEAIEQLVNAQRPDIRRVRVGKVEAIANTPHLRKTERQREAQEQRRREVERHPLVVELIERFGGTLGAIDLYEV